MPVFPVHSGSVTQPMLIESRNYRARPSQGRWVSALGALCLAAIALPAQASETASASVASTPLLQATTTWAGQPLEIPQGPVAVTAMEIRLAPGAETGWHSHPVPSMAYILDGELEITLEDGRKQRASKGQALVEVAELIHNGRNVGTEPVRLVVFYVAPPDTALSQAAVR